jgi:hypothetical protein
VLSVGGGSVGWREIEQCEVLGLTLDYYSKTE